VIGDALHEKALELVVLGQSLQRGLKGMQVARHDVVDFGGLGPVQEGVADLAGVLFAALAAEREDEGGQEMLVAEEIEAVIELVLEGLGPYLALHGALFACDDLVVHLLLELLVAVANGFDRLQVGLVGFLVEDLVGAQNDLELVSDGIQDRVSERHDSVIRLNKMQGDLLEGSEPLGKGRRVSEGRRESDDLYGRWKENETLFPDLAAIGVVDVVTFVEDHDAEVLEGQGGRETERLCLGAGLVEQIAKDLRGHDEDLGVGPVLHVARHNADRCLRELAFEIAELLVRQGFDRGRDEGPLAFVQGLEDGELSDSALAGPRGGAGKNVVIQMDGLLGILLEGIERVLQGVGGEIANRDREIGLNEVGHSWFWEEWMI